MRRALVIGINEYSFGPLAGCVNDALEISRLLKTHYDGAPNFDVRLRTAPPDSVTRASLRADLEHLFGSPAEVALLYFSGHGSENDLGGYLVTQDAASYDEGVAMADVITLANRSTVTEVVIIVDSCHSGYLGNQNGPRDQNAKAEIREGVSILTASRSSESAMEKAGRGVFTTLVCSALESGAADVEGHTTVAGIFAHVDKSLGPWEQRPLIKTHVSSLLTLRCAEPAVDPATLRKICHVFPSADYELRMDPTFEASDPSAINANVTTYNLLVKYRDARLAVVMTHAHMYYAAMESGSVRLTPLGQHYWKLAKEGRI